MAEYNWCCARCNKMITMGSKEAMKKARKEHRCVQEYVVKHESKPYMVRTAQMGHVLIDPATGQPMRPKSKKGRNAPPVPMDEIKEAIRAETGSDNPIIIEGKTMEAKSLDLVEP